MVMTPAIGSLWTLTERGAPDCVFKVVDDSRPGWRLLEVVEDRRQGAYEVGFRFEVEKVWFELRGRKL
jgi:hypothetical protein